MIKVIFLRR